MTDQSAPHGRCPTCGYAYKGKKSKPCAKPRSKQMTVERPEVVKDDHLEYLESWVETSPEKSQSNYTFRLIPEERRIHINDLCDELGGMSVTNNAENVIAEVNDLMPIFGMTISYTDTCGDTDELLHDGKLFSGFAPGRGRW